jgi:hypothetical protein
MPKRSPLENARRWWKERVDADRYVVSPAEAPSVAVARILRQEGLVLDVAAKRVGRKFISGTSPSASIRS